jgi:hypothetical protein
LQPLPAVKKRRDTLLAGPGIAICDECLGDLSVILAEQHSDWREAQIARLSKLGPPPITN